MEAVRAGSRAVNSRLEIWENARMNQPARVAPSALTAPGFYPTDAISPARSTSALDLSPIPNKKYFNSIREWREDFIYFLLVDRFDDGRPRSPVRGSSRSNGGGPTPQLSRFCGGNLKGVTRHLDYIYGLGCTGIWLSPIFENVNDPASYHGYGIQSYLDIDPRFGTKQDLIELVEAAHRLEMRVFLDVVINHMGDVWSYPGDYQYYYFQDQVFPFDAFRRADRPSPSELRDPTLFHRRGQIKDFDAFPEFEHGDFFSLKDLAHDDTPQGQRLIEVLTAAHCYWIREADVDGFRMDAVKHLSRLATARFCSNVREYAYKLGKRSFLTFGELIAGDDAIDRFIGPNTSSLDGQRVFFGIESVLDFPLYFVLPNVIKGFSPPGELFARYDRQRQRALNSGELGQYLVTFLDNHDGVGQPDDAKRRFAADAPDDQVIAGMGFLLCALGTTCIYYGTEQGFSGKGPGDSILRQTLFDLDDPTKTFLNPECRIYQQIAIISNLTDEIPSLKHGRMYFREVSGNGRDFGRPIAQPCTLAFSRLLADEEALVAYNTSVQEARTDYVVVDAELNGALGDLVVRYDSKGLLTGARVPVLAHPDPGNSLRAVKLSLEPMQFVILTKPVGPRSA
jgi:glycosidase